MYKIYGLDAFNFSQGGLVFLANNIVFIHDKLEHTSIITSHIR